MIKSMDLNNNSFSKRLEKLLSGNKPSIIDLVKGKSDKDIIESGGKSLLSNVYITDSLISEFPFLLENVEFSDHLLWNQFLSEEYLLKIIDLGGIHLLREILITQDLSEDFIKSYVDIERFSKILLSFQRLSIKFIKDNLEAFKPHLSSCLKYQGFSKEEVLIEFGIDPYFGEKYKRGVIDNNLFKGYNIRNNFLENCALITSKRALEPKDHAIKKYLFRKMERPLFSINSIRKFLLKSYKNPEDIKKLKDEVIFMVMDVNINQVFTKSTSIVSTVSEQIRYNNISELIWRRNKERT